MNYYTSQLMHILWDEDIRTSFHLLLKFSLQEQYLQVRALAGAKNIPKRALSSTMALPTQLPSHTVRGCSYDCWPITMTLTQAARPLPPPSAVQTKPDTSRSRGGAYVDSHPHAPVGRDSKIITKKALGTLDSSV